MHEDSHENSPLGVAIISIACRFPGARTIDEFWHNLRNGIESVTTLSDDDLLSAGVNARTFRDPRYVRRVAIVEDADLFDASFFGFTPREAEIMDPQHRVFLECASEVLESAGYDPERYAGRIGVFAGASPNTYLLNLYSHPEIIRSISGLQANIASEKDHLTTLVSYKLNLKGPGVTVQTACSTSLVAVHLACQSLLNGECDMALAGGVCIGARQKVGYLHHEGDVLSPDGYCRTFDADANGTVAGNGAGIVLLKRLDDAIADGDQIHAVIRGSAINNDGSQKVGYTAPSVVGQAHVIAEAQAVAGVDPETINYVEAHGTATPLGDPIEVAALRKAFGSRTAEKNFCALGSVKSNIGHLDAAAGVAGLIKAVLAVKHGEIPPSLHYKRPNPKIDLDGGPFYVAAKLRQWETREHPRRAGVSSFGIGGTNAHVIVEEAPSPVVTEESRRKLQLLTLSARTAGALEDASRRLGEHLRAHNEPNLGDVSFTLASGRREFNHRRIVIGGDRTEAADALESADAKRVLSGRSGARDLPVVFMLPGQGAQHVAMGGGIYASEPLFRAEVDRCCELLKPQLQVDLRELLYPAASQCDDASPRLTETQFAQPALFVTEYALARLWMSWGVRPAAMIGHSIGEYVAACLAGVMSLPDALKLVATRGRLVQKLPQGSMLSVEMTAAEARDVLHGIESVSLAAVNSARRSVFSGTHEAIAELAQRLNKGGVASRRLETSHAFHSSMMDPILDSFAEVLRSVKLQAPQIPYVSNLTGKWIRAEEAANPDYWVKHLRNTVLFADGIDQLKELGEHVLLEVGPGTTLSSLARESNAESNADAHTVNSLRHPQDEQPDEAVLLKALGKLWLLGARVDWSGFFAGEKRRRVALPTYPLERQRYWIAEQRRSDRKLNKRNVETWFHLASWQRTLAPSFDAEMLASPRVWLVFVDRSGLGEAAAKRLSQAGEEVIHVLPGEQFLQVHNKEYQVRPGECADYERLWKSLAERQLTLEMVLHLWSVDTANDFEQTQAHGFYSLLYFAQALAKQNFTKPLQLLVVSSHVQSVTGDEPLVPAKATILGPCKVIPQELRNVTCKHVDVALKDNNQQTVDHLIAEILHGPPELGIAYRNGQRWINTFEPVRLEERPGGRSLLREHGVYLVTGGLGRIGSILADHLARTVRAKLVLIGKTHNASRTLTTLKRLEDLGAEVMVVSADVSDEEQMRSVLRQAHERFGALHGVIHAAGKIGVNSLCEIPEAEDDDCEAQFLPKIRGLETLERILAGQQLDFCLLMSSLSSVIGGLGMTAYSAANAFMDAFAHRQSRTSSTRWIAVNWDGWEFDPHAEGSVITPELGTESFHLILSQPGFTQIAVAPSNLEERIDRWIKFEIGEEPASERPVEVTPRAELQSTYVAPRNEIEERVAKIWQELFGIERIGIHDNFFELGGHSLLATSLVARAREVLDVAPPLRAIYELPTIAEWSQVVLSSAQQELRVRSVAAQGNGTSTQQSTKRSLPFSLVQLQSRGSQRPFFCVHGRRGGVSSYYHLAYYLGTDRPFYGLQCNGLDGSEEPYTSVEEIAAHYLRVMRAVQHEGPYAIGGWSFGGLVALEMAQQLSARGEGVALLSLIDTHARNTEDLLPLDTKSILWEMMIDSFKVPEEQLVELQLEDDIDAYWQFLKSEGKVPSNSANFLPGYVNVSKANNTALLNYVQRPYAGKVVLFQAAAERDVAVEQQVAEWNSLAEVVEAHVLPCSHNDIVKEPHVKTLAALLSERLKQVD
jgi:acyl transferase domain-containing protein/thioesterase domain-containing protein